MRQRQVAFPTIMGLSGIVVALIGARYHVGTVRGVGLLMVTIACASIVMRWPWRSRSSMTPRADLAPLADATASTHPHEVILAIKEFRAQTGVGLAEAKAQILAAYARREG